MTETLTLTEAERRRVDKVDALVARGTSGIGALLGMLDDPSWTVRRAVTSSLSALGDDAVPSLCTWLVDRRTSEAGIAAAIDALVGSLSPRVPEVVAPLLGHTKPAVAADAATILGRCRARTAVPQLSALLDHPDDNVAMAAIEALGTIGGTSVVEPLIAVLAQRNFFRTFPALQVLAGTADPRAIEAIAGLIDDPMYRDDAVRALGRTGSLQAIAPIVAVLDDSTALLVAQALADLLELARWSGSEPQVADALARTLASQGSLFVLAFRDAPVLDASAIAAVLGAVGDPASASVLAARFDDPGLQPAVTAALKRLAKRQPGAIDVLCAERSSRARAFALDLMTSKAGVLAAQAALGDEDGEVRARACAAVARLGAVELIPRLFALLADPDPRASHAAVAAINSLGTDEARAMATIAVRSPDPGVRRHGLRIAGYLGVADVFELACEAIADPDPKVRHAAIATLGLTEDPRADAKLIELVDDRDEQIRIAATRAATRRAGPAMAAVLVRAIGDDSPWVRYHACQGLGLQGDPATTSLLIGRLSDPMPHVRIAAIEALARIPTPAAWQTLCSYARSQDPEQQRVALAGLALHDPEAAVEHLLAGLESLDLATRLVALSGLAAARAPQALEAIARAAAGAATDLRDAAVSLLAERPDIGAARKLVELAVVQPADHPARAALSHAGRARVEAIVERLISADGATAQRLCAALGAMRDANEALIGQLSSPNPAARRYAATTLAATNVRSARALIAKLAHEDPDPEVRATCTALGVK